MIKFVYNNTQSIKDRQLMLLSAAYNRLSKKYDDIQQKFAHKNIGITNFPDTYYIQQNYDTILKLLSYKSNNFIDSLLTWVKTGKRWTKRQQYYAELYPNKDKTGVIV